MLRQWIVAVLVLPGTVLLLVPALLLLLSRGTRWQAAAADPRSAEFWLALPLAAAGLYLAVWTASLFFRVGQGTPAPWAPPRRFVVRGPYRHVRNPMITSVFLLLSAEALFLRSWPILLWLLFFMALNAIYIPLFEEEGLEKRFGDEYHVYTRHVPRWIPRLSPWSAEAQEDTSPHPEPRA